MTHYLKNKNVLNLGWFHWWRCSVCVLVFWSMLCLILNFLGLCLNLNLLDLSFCFEFLNLIKIEIKKKNFWLPKILVIKVFFFFWGSFWYNGVLKHYYSQFFFLKKKNIRVYRCILECGCRLMTYSRVC